MSFFGFGVFSCHRKKTMREQNRMFWIDEEWCKTKKNDLEEIGIKEKHLECRQKKEIWMNWKFKLGNLKIFYCNNILKKEGK